MCRGKGKLYCFCSIRGLRNSDEMEQRRAEATQFNSIDTFVEQ